VIKLQVHTASAATAGNWTRSLRNTGDVAGRAAPV